MFEDMFWTTGQIGYYLLSKQLTNNYEYEYDEREFSPDDK